MRVLLFGASGLIGQGVLRECLLDPDIEAVRMVGRSPARVQHPNVSDVVHGDFWNFSAIEAQLTPFDACFYCLGASSVGMKEPEYERLTYGIALATAETLARLNPGVTFIFISGAGADSSERGRVMWTRIKGKTENAILRLPFRATYVFRPGLVVPVHGV